MAAIGIIGLLALIAGIIMLIVNAVRKRKLHIWGIVAGAGLVSFIIAVSLSGTPSSPPTSTSSAPPAPTPVRIPITATTPAITTMTSSELCDEYKANEVAADLRYKDKIIRVIGIVNSISKDILGTPYVELTSGGRYEFFGVQCMFDQKYESELAQLTKGQKVTIQGRVSGYLVNVLIKDSILVR